MSSYMWEWDCFNVWEKSYLGVSKNVTESYRRVKWDFKIEKNQILKSYCEVPNMNLLNMNLFIMKAYADENVNLMGLFTPLYFKYLKR